MNCHLSAEVKQTFTVVFNSVSIWQGKSVIFQCQTPLNKTLGTSQAAIYCAGQLAGSMCPPALIVINEGYCADTAFFSEEPSGTTSCILLESRRRDKALERFKPLRTGPAVPGKPLIFPIETTSNHHENGGLGGWVAPRPVEAGVPLPPVVLCHASVKRLVLPSGSFSWRSGDPT